MSHSTAGSSGRSLKMRRAVSHSTAENFVKTTLEERDSLNHRMKSRQIYLPYKTTEPYLRVLQAWILEKEQFNTFLMDLPRSPFSFTINQTL